MKIIAFAGPARAGKSECAGILSASIDKNYKVIRESFAKPMRDAWERLATHLTWKTGELVNRDTKPDLYRSTMQRWGASRRSRDQDHWVAKMVGRLVYHNYEEQQRYDRNQHLNNWRETVVVIDDVRYLNEVVAVRQLNGVCIFVDPGDRLDLMGEWRRHESERLAMDYKEGRIEGMLFDDTIVNAGSRSRLLTRVVKVMDRWLNEAETFIRMPK